MRIFLIGAAFVAALAVAGCGYVPAGTLPSGVVAAPAGVTSGPACRVWDQDIYGRRYCRVRYVYPAAR